MRPLLIAVAAAASTIAFTQIASAADMPTKAPAYAPPPSTPVYSWTGFYVGGNVGYGWGSRTVNFTPNDLNVFASSCGGSFGSTCPPPASFDINGALGGLQAGYNWPFNQNWLAGIETDGRQVGDVRLPGHHLVVRNDDVRVVLEAAIGMILLCGQQYAVTA